MKQRSAAQFVGVLVAIFGPSSADVVAQTVPTPGRLWVTAGVGVGAFGEGGSGISVTADMTYQRGPHLMVLRVTGLTDLNTRGGPDDSVADIGLLYGRASTRTGSSVHFSAAAGLALIELDLPGTIIQHTVGVPIAVEATVNTPIIGLGLKGIANVNSVQSFAGLFLVLRLGRLR